MLPQVSGGLLPLPVHVDVILWLNLDMDGVKPALVRLGRCLSRLQVRPLPFHQAQDLVPFRLEGHREYSLAEVNEILGTGGEGGYSARDVALRRHSQPWGGAKLDLLNLVNSRPVPVPIPSPRAPQAPSAVAFPRL